MRKPGAYIFSFLAVAFIALPMLCIPLLQGLQWLAQLRAEHRLEKKALQHLCIPHQKLQWEKKGKELRINGSLFDVKTIRYSFGKVCLTGLYDRQETAIVQLLQQAANQSRHNHFIIQWLLLSQSLFFMAASALPLFLKLLSRYLFPVNALLYVNPFRTIFSPPPRGTF